MTSSTPLPAAFAPSPVATLSVVIGALMDDVAKWGGQGLLGRVLTVALHGLLSGMRGRMERMASRFQRGLLRRVGPRAVGVSARKAIAAAPGDGAASRGDGAAARGDGAAGRGWPAGFGWLVRLVAHPAAGYGSQLRAALERPEMVALLVAAPQAARVLGPLCRMLAVEGAVLRPSAAGRGARAGALADGGADGAAAVRPSVALPVTGSQVMGGASLTHPTTGWGGWGLPLPRGVAAAVRRRRLRRDD